MDKAVGIANCVDCKEVRYFLKPLKPLLVESKGTLSVRLFCI